MRVTRPFKGKPWLELHEPGFWESLFGCPSRLTLNTKHPEWVEKVLKPTLKKLGKEKV